MPIPSEKCLANLNSQKSLRVNWGMRVILAIDYPPYIFTLQNTSWKTVFHLSVLHCRQSLVHFGLRTHTGPFCTDASHWYICFGPCHWLIYFHVRLVTGPFSGLFRLIGCIINPVMSDKFSRHGIKR